MSHNSVKATRTDLVNVAAINDLRGLVQSIRKIIPPHCKEPINVVAHSQGTMITLAALSDITLENVILLNSPMHVTKGGAYLDQVAQRAALIRHYWSQTDKVVRLINGNKFKGPTTEIENVGAANFLQHEIGGGHGDSHTAQRGFADYGLVTANGILNKLSANKQFRKDLAQVLRNFPTVSVIGEKLLDVKQGKVVVPK